MCFRDFFFFLSRNNKLTSLRFRLLGGETFELFMSSTLYTAIPRFAKASVADTVSQLSVRMSVVFYTNSTWTKRTVHTATMELTLTVTHTKYRSKYPRHSNNSLGQNWLDMSHNVCHYRRIAVALAADGRGNCCGWTSAETAVAIASDFLC